MNKILISLLLVCFIIGSAIASTGVSASQSSGIAWGFLVMGLFGGLSFFLYGMEMMSEGMKKTAGSQMRSILAALTSNRFFAFLAGAFVTMVIQSSSATTVMLVSFVQAELMTFAQSLGVIFGANIGTTVTAQLIAFKLTDYALGMIAFGFALKMFAKNDKYGEIGNIILGFGILFFGMKLMSDSMSPLRTLPGFIDMIKGLENPFLGIIVGSVFTALIQSSSAFTGIVIVLAQQGFITLEAGIPLIFGANIGTCITAVLASIGTSREAKRVAIAHILFQVVGVLLFIWWIPSFANLITEVSDFFGSSQIARQIANAHTIFNVSVGIAILPFTGLLASIIMKIFPAKYEKKPGDSEIKVWHLDDSIIETPSLAIDLVRTEIARMAKLLNRMLNAIIIPFISDPDLIRANPNIPKDEKGRLIREIPSHDMIFKHLTLQEGIDLRERKIDFLDEKIHEYLMKIARQELNEDEAEEVFRMTSVTNDMESIGDIIHRNMLPLLKKKKALKVEFSTEGKEDLMRYHRKVTKQLRRLQDTFEEKDKDIANTIMVKETEYSDLETRFRLKHMHRVLQKKDKSLKTHETHLEFMDLLKQINVYTINIAKILVT